MKYIKNCEILRLLNTKDTSSIDHVRKYLRCTKNNASIWNELLVYDDILSDIIEEFQDLISWNKIPNDVKLSENIIRKYSDKIKWSGLCTKSLSESIIRDFQDKVSWYKVFLELDLSEDFIREFQDKACWDVLCSRARKNQFADEFISEFENKLNWRLISIHHKLTEGFMEKYKDKLDWSSIVKNQKLSEEFIVRNKELLSWKFIVRYQRLSEKFIIDNIDLNLWWWKDIPFSQTLSESFIRKFHHNLNWEDIISTQTLSEDFMEEFKDYMDWSKVVKNQMISEGFIRKFAKEFDNCWHDICINQKLSEDFMREFQHRILWSRVSSSQILSEDFMREFAYELKSDYIFKYQLVSDKFIDEFCKSRYIPILKNGKIQNDMTLSGKIYNMTDDDYIIGYKVLNHSMKSIFRNISYEIGKETEYRNCDISYDICSFGYNFYTDLDTARYNNISNSNTIIVKVLIKKEDVGVIMEEIDVGRCYKLTPIEIVE